MPPHARAGLSRSGGSLLAAGTGAGDHVVMSWTAPEIERPFPPQAAAERATLEGYLEFHRATLLWKCAGLDGEQLARRPVAPSNLSLLGLVRHLAEAERAWFRREFRGERLTGLYSNEDFPDAAFEDARADRAEADYGRLIEESGLARQAVAGASLDEEFTHAEFGRESLRGLYTHMIEEYARHNGHADLLRQCIDGTTGD
jgi:hypothetical protein